SPRASTPTPPRALSGAVPTARDAEGKSLPRAYVVARRRSTPRGISISLPPDDVAAESSQATRRADPAPNAEPVKPAPALQPPAVVPAIAPVVPPVATNVVARTPTTVSSEPAMPANPAPQIASSTPAPSVAPAAAIISTSASPGPSLTPAPSYTPDI